MNKKSILILISVFILPFFNGIAYAEGGPWTGNVNLFLGSKALNTNDWSPVETQGEVAVEWDFRERSWPINILLGLRSSDKTTSQGGIDFEGKTSEFSLGVRKYWDFPPYNIHPYLGGGFSDINAEITASVPGNSASLSGSGLGTWFGGGVVWVLGNHFNIGFDLRASSASVTMGGISGNAGGGHAGLLLGYHY
ncbi:MAG TPA: outer membrane beta-barrel protein [Nitrospiria bacterium]|nr:outer membrane beta-barrel protein [Nitrospiria bacterium]